MSTTRHNKNVRQQGKMSLLILGFLVATAALYFLGLDRYGLFDVDEAVFAQSSKEMLVSQDYVTPTYNGEPRYHKPPLIYWFQATSMHFLGETPMAARLPSAILAFLTILAFYISLDGMTRNARFALMASAILGLNLSFVALARSSVADMALIFFTLAATLTLVSNIYAVERRTMPIVISGFLLAGALLAKGPIAFLVPTVVIGVVALARPGFGHNLKRINPILLLPAMLLALVPWVHLITQAHGMDFFKEFILVHNIERFFGGFGNTHSSSPSYYLLVLLIGFFPWVMFLPSAIFWAGRNFGRMLRSDKAIDALPAVGLIWLVVIVAFFSFSQTKLAHYIVPALPGAALLIAGRLNALNEKPLARANLLWMMPLIAFFSFIFLTFKWLPAGLMGEGALAGIFAKLSETFHFAWPVTDDMMTAILSQDITIGITPVIIGAILLAGVAKSLFLISSGHRQGVFAMAITYWMVLALVCVNIVPTVYQYMQQPLAELAEAIKEQATPNTHIYYVSLHHPSLRFISEQPFTPLDDPVQIGEIPLLPAHALFVVDENHKEGTLSYMPKHADIQCKGGYCLISVKRQQKRQNNRDSSWY